MSEEWGPWIEHDGNGPPDLMDGILIEARAVALQAGDLYKAGQVVISRAIYDQKTRDHAAWYKENVGKWCTHPKSGRRGVSAGVITHYRIRKPKGLTILEDIAAEPEKVEVDA